MQSVAVVGSKGYVGSALAESLARTGVYEVHGVIRENYDEMKAKHFDVLINCAMPSGKYWANTHSDLDYEETVQKTRDLLSWNFDKFVQISTVSARCQLDTVYGRHKAEAEKLVGSGGKNLIIRLGAIYSADMTKGVLFDILQGNKVFAGGDSRYSFIPLEWCTEWIASHLDRTGVVELGGKNAITLKDVAKHIGANVEFEGTVNHLDVESKEGLPEAADVLRFLDARTR